jgi:hypothetical protein
MGAGRSIWEMSAYSMTLTEKQLESALKKATKELPTKKDFQYVEEGIAGTVGQAFDEFENRLNQHLEKQDKQLEAIQLTDERIERVVNKWPPGDTRTRRSRGGTRTATGT